MPAHAKEAPKAPPQSSRPPSPTPPPSPSPPPAKGLQAAPLASPPPPRKPPPKAPPLPEVPRRVRGGAPLPGSGPPVELPPEPSKWRDLPGDPVERAKCREEVRGEARVVLAVLDAIALTAPPHRPLSGEADAHGIFEPTSEKGTIQGPLEETIWRYAGQIDPAWLLLGALALVAAGRAIEVRATRGAFAAAASSAGVPGTTPPEPAKGTA
jgi:hypothetical protein